MSRKDNNHYITKVSVGVSIVYIETQEHFNRYLDNNDYGTYFRTKGNYIGDGKYIILDYYEPIPNGICVKVIEVIPFNYTFDIKEFLSELYNKWTL